MLSSSRRTKSTIFPGFDISKRLDKVLQQISFIYDEIDIRKGVESDNALIELTRDIFKYLDDVLNYIKDNIDNRRNLYESLLLLQTITESMEKSNRIFLKILRKFLIIFFSLLY